MFKVIIAGGRYFHDYKLLREFVDYKLSRVREIDTIEIVSGHCHGADLLGEAYARERKYGCKIFPAKWSVYGQAAGPMRNRQMAEYADALIAFWNGRSKGTKNMIDTARELGLKVSVKYYE